ncbi:MAG: glycosyltransferase [bacterium]
MKKKIAASRITRNLFPIGSKRRKYIVRIVKKTMNKKTVTNYSDWQKRVEPMSFDKSKNYSHKYKPLISIVVPCYNTPFKYIDPMVDSVLQQDYKNWQLCLVDGSSEQQSKELIAKYSNIDVRIQYLSVENTGIVGNTNQGIGIATGEFVAFLDHDDTLSPHALSEVIRELNVNAELDLIYSDEDKISDDGRNRLLPFFKPDWSPELLLGVNYVTHFVVARKTIIDEIGGLRAGFDGAQDYDFLLRFTEKTKNIKHIPKILYHWRLADGSTSKDVGEKDYADTAGRRALRDAVSRRNIDAKVVEITERPTNYRLRYALPGKKPLISIIIPFKDKVEYLQRCIPSILEKTTYDNYEIILLSNNSTEQETHDYLKILKNDKRCKVFEWNHKFNYSAVNNYGRQKATGEYLVFLNNDTKIITPSWIEELVGVAFQPQTGAVGPLLRYPDKSIQHAGVILGMGGMAGHVFRLLQPEQWTDFGLPCWPRNYLAVTGACLAINANKFDELGGFDEKLTIGGNDVALGIKAHEAGYRNVYWPFVELIHYENISVGPYSSNVPIGDYNRSMKYYSKYLKTGDPFFNPNLSLNNEQIALGDKHDH